MKKITKKHLKKILNVLAFILCFTMVQNMAFAQADKSGSYVPPGCKSTTISGDKVFYDMYLDADMEWI